MELIHNRYLIDGIDAIELVEKYGTPVYVYETARMKQQPPPPALTQRRNLHKIALPPHLHRPQKEVEIKVNRVSPRVTQPNQYRRIEDEKDNIIRHNIHTVAVDGCLPAIS